MANRITAAFMAVSLFVTLTACRMQDETTTAANESSAAAATTEITISKTEDSAAATESATVLSTAATQEQTGKTTVSESSHSSAVQSPDTDNALQQELFSIKLHDHNIISLFENDLEAQPTGSELYTAVQAAIGQYRAAEARDLDAYIKSFRFTDLAEPTVTILRDMYLHPDDNLRDYLVDSGLGAKYELVDDLVTLMYELVDEKSKDEFFEIDEKYRPEKHDEMLSFLQQAYAGITADSQRVKENIETETLFDGENGVDLLGGITDDTVYTVYVEHCSREKTTDGSNIYMFCSLIIDTAEKEYVMPNVYCWIVNGQCGVWIDDSMQTQTIHAEIKGKTASEIYEMLK